MVYINSDGNVGNSRQRRKWYDITIVRDFIVGIFDFVGLFFRTLTSSPATLESERGQRRTTYAERQGIRRGNGGGGGGANVRGINRCGTAKAAAGG